MSNQPLATIAFSRTKPIRWRLVDPGLCLEGRCLTPNTRCSAYLSMVIGNFRMGRYNISSMNTFRCPECGNDVHAVKYGFNLCQWRERKSDKWTNVNDAYQTYALTSSPIQIETRPLDEVSNSSEKCTICLSSMKKDKTCSILPCKHVFHLECIHNWMDADEDTSLQCPICRRPIFQ